jgi:hypothetical protein
MGEKEIYERRRRKVEGKKEGGRKMEGKGMKKSKREAGAEGGRVVAGHERKVRELHGREGERYGRQGERYGMWEREERGWGERLREGIMGGDKLYREYFALRLHCLHVNPETVAF